MASTDARPLPIKNTAYRLTFPIYKSDGTLITGATGLDSEVSKDAGTFADCTNEATEIATSSGVYYLDITSTEMNADCVAIVVKTTSTGAVPPCFILYPQESGDVKVDVQSWLATAVSTPTVAGVPNVNVKTWNDLTTVALPLVPTTAGRTLDVSATGEAGIDWANIGSPTTSVALSGTSVLLTNGTGTGQVSLSSGAVKIQTGLKKNQALANFPFLMRDSTNHNPVTGLTVTGTRSLDGAAFASGTIANMTEVGSGVYQCDLGAGDMNADTVCLRFTATGADDLVVTLVTEP